MIIDVKQRKESIDISYVDEKNQLSVESIIFDSSKKIHEDNEEHISEYHNFIECDESDPNKHPNIKSFHNKSVKLEKDKYFRHHNMNYFLGYEIPKFYPEQAKKFNSLSVPNLFSVDIETVISDEFGYSDEEKVENSIRSISFTDNNMKTLLFITKNNLHPEFSVVDTLYIDGILQEALGEYYNQYDLKYEIKVFDTEYEMLNYFIECMREYFHVIIGWNFISFDWRYIFNRCDKIGLDIKRTSPTRQMNKNRIKINNSKHINIQTPAHRIIIDYMQLFRESLIYNNLGKYDLNSISELVLGLKKVLYQGNLKKLYEDDYLKFVAYALVDTILVMLLHKTTNLMGVEFFQSYYTGVPFLKLSQNSISEALVYKELISDNIILLESEKSEIPEREYQGGFVKSPTRKIVDSVAGFDFGSLYPNSMITVGCSPESKIDSLNVDELGFPCDEESKKKWQKYKSMGYCLSPMGRIYDVSKDYLYTRIEKKLLSERKIYKNHMTDLYLRVIPDISKRIKELENQKS